MGTALDSGVAAGSGEDAGYNFRVQVDEAFIGLPPKTKQVVLAIGQQSLVKGHTYLFDVIRTKDGQYLPMLCGATDEVTSRYAAADLAYLRERAKGNASTSLSVSVRGSNQPLSGANVLVTGPVSAFKSITGEDGFAKFDALQPGQYHVEANRAHFRVDLESGFNLDPTVVPGSCANSSVSLESEATVSGRLRDAQGAPVAALNLELITDAANPSASAPMPKHYFTAQTEQDGTFRFDSVMPGRYLLGSNVMGFHSSTIPPTYYPGRPERDGAVPINVELGEDVTGLDFVLPDLGKTRQIKVCVVDESGLPVSGAGIRVVFGKDSAAIANLGDNLVVGEDGCVSVNGFARLVYPIMALHRPASADLRQTRLSETVTISAGEEAVALVLRLGKPIGLPKPE